MAVRSRSPFSDVEAAAPPARRDKDPGHAETWGVFDTGAYGGAFGAKRRRETPPQTLASGRQERPVTCSASSVVHVGAGPGPIPPSPPPLDRSAMSGSGPGICLPRSSVPASERSRSSSRCHEGGFSLPAFPPFNQEEAMSEDRTRSFRASVHDRALEGQVQPPGVAGARGAQDQRPALRLRADRR